MNRPKLSILHLATLSCFAFAVPLLDLLARQAEFFVIRSIPRHEVICLVLALLLVLPLPVVLLSWLASRISDRLGAWVSAALLGGLFAIVALRFAKVWSVGGGGAILLALAAGTAFGWSVRRTAATPLFLSVLSPALVVVPLLFFLNGNISRALGETGEHSATAYRETKTPTPVIIIVFDEFSFTSLLNADGEIDRRRLPQLASFADRATWYKNAVAAGDVTEIAVPALLTGRLPTEAKFPNLAAYPDNLFTLFGVGTPIFAQEPITSLCPSRLNRLQRVVPPFHQRMTRLVSDLAVVWLHLVVPGPWQDALPSISGTWGDFRPAAEPRPSGSARPGGNDRHRLSRPGHGALERDRLAGFRTFVHSIDADESPGIYFGHFLLPHRPWEYLPSGRRYAAPGIRQGAWGHAPDLVAQGFQRYLAQVGLVDRLLGELFDHLRDQDLFDRSLIVITADHGVSFRPGDERRAYTPTNVFDVLPIPLFIKTPGQREGAVLERATSSIDILPTIADILGLELPWPHDGQSRVAGREGEPPSHFFSKYRGVLPIPPNLHDEKYRALDRRPALLGLTIDEPEDIFRIGPRPELVGRRWTTFSEVVSGSMVVTIQGHSFYDEIDPTTSSFPALIQGEIRSPEDACCELAVAIGGTIYATTRTHPSTSARKSFSALVPEHALAGGRNVIDVLTVTGPRDAPRFELLRPRQRKDYRLTRGTATSLQAIEVEGQRYPIGDHLEGWFTDTIIAEDAMVITGWAVDRSGQRLADELAVFSEGRFVYAGSTTVNRPEVVARFDNERLARSGFRFEIPLSRIPTVRDHGLQIFALSVEGQAAELGFFVLRQGRRADGSEYLEAGNGRRFNVLPGPAQAWLDTIIPMPDGILGADGAEDVALTGWAGDPETGRVADRIVAFHQGKYHSQTAPGIERQDVAAAFGHESLLLSGFRLRLSAAAFEALEQRNGRVYAVFFQEGIAVEAQLSPAVTDSSRSFL